MNIRKTLFDMNLDPFLTICVTVTCAVLLASNLTRAELDERHRSPVVQTDSGTVFGKIENLPHGKSVHEYLSIPYAEPPVGELRFVAPKPVKPWSGIKDATEFGASCVQAESLPIPGVEKTHSVGYSEDCLFLNVFVPSTIKPDDKLPVMVWIYGGGFSYGTSTIYPGGVLATFNDVIVASFNYRVGVLGFFNIPGTDYKGNYGMLDQGGQPPYVYVFDHRPVYSRIPDWMGVVHAVDVGFVFGAPFKNIHDSFVNMIAMKYSEIEKGLSLYLMKLWTDFAKYGSPNPPDSSPSPVMWPKFTEQEQEYLVLDVKPRVQSRYHAEKVAFWNEIVPKVAEVLQTVEKKINNERTPKDEL